MSQALVSLLEVKEFDYITVKELCQKAGVNRSTFYLHYETTMDLLSETIRRQLDDFLSYFTPSPNLSDGFLTCPLEDLMFISEDYLLPYLNYIQEHKKIFRTTVNHPDVFNNEKVYTQLFTYVFDPILTRFHYTEAQRHYVMRFYLAGITAIVMEWLKNDCRESVESIAQVIGISIFGKNE